MKNSALVLLVIAALLFITNPDAVTHRDAYKRQFQGNHPVLSLLRGDELTALAVEYQSYGVFSISHIGEEYIAIGILGKVVPVQSF
jgi:hypothetical protein